MDQAKYLGLTITKNLSWKKHISNIISKATNVRLYLQRNLLYFDKESKLLCYKVFVRPILEYACPVWSPNGTHSLIEDLEMVQRKAARWIENKWQYVFSPTQMIRLLKLQSLKTRRQLACLKLLFDISNNLKFVEDKIKPTRQRCTNIRYQRQHARVKVYKNSYFPFTIELWNKLPSKISNELTRNKFIASLEKSYENY